MSEQYESRKSADKSAAIAHETLEKTAERSARAFEQNYSSIVEDMRDYNRKIVDMVHANVEAIFEVARQLTTAKTPSDVIELWMWHAGKQCEVLSEQTKELTALGQKSAGKRAELIARSVN